MTGNAIALADCYSGDCLVLVDPDGHATIEEMCELAPPPPWRRPKEGADEEDEEDEEDDAAGAEADEAEVDAAVAV